jgi:5-oxoprolinase (ATP-hydrolysing)/N-methylhydantoinase A
MDREGTVVHDCGTGELVTLTTTERVVEVCLAGGSGFGDPRERAKASLDDDVVDGYVSADAAMSVYGVPTSASAAE